MKKATASLTYIYILFYKIIRKQSKKYFYFKKYKKREEKKILLSNKANEAWLYNFGTKKPKKKKKRGVGDCWRKVSSVCLIQLLNPSDKKKIKRKIRPEREREREAREALERESVSQKRQL